MQTDAKSQADAKKEVVTTITPDMIPKQPTMFLTGSQQESAERTKPQQTPRPPRHTPDSNEVSMESDKFRKQRSPDENITGTGGANLDKPDGFQTCDQLK